MQNKQNNPIGIFDSGIGGLSVLAEAQKQLPHEDFIYFSDSVNFPYGDKKSDELKKIIIKNIKTLIGEGCKAVVVACNTATSVAIEDLRKKIPILIIGMEPAIKPALEGKHKKILVLATSLTLRLEKFDQLRTKLDKDDDLIILPAKGLASLIEKNSSRQIASPPTSLGFDGASKKEIEQYLKKLFSKINKDEISTIVLGCTHYIFIKDMIKKFFPGKNIIDGNTGTITQLKKILKDNNLLNKKKVKGSLCQINTK